MLAGAGKRRKEEDVPIDTREERKGRLIFRYKAKDNGRRGRAHAKTGGADNNV